MTEFPVLIPQSLAVVMNFVILTLCFIVQGAKEPWSKEPGLVTEGGLGLGEGSRRMASGLEVVLASVRGKWQQSKLDLGKVSRP